jgi:hypothetical protein
VPALDPDQVEPLWCDLDAAAAAWRATSLQARLDRLHRIVAHLRRRGPGPWREALARSTGLSPQGLDAAWEVTFAPHQRTAFEEALAAEGLRTLEPRRLPRRLSHVLSGNVLASVLSVLLRGWILGASQWLRPAGREPLLAACLMEDLQQLAPELAACTAVLWWPHEAEALERAVLGASDVFTVQGSDASIAALEAKRQRWPSPPPWIAYGSRWSAACVTAASQTAETAAALGWDTALFDQQGCLSPTLVFAERSDRLQPWCADLAAALDAQEARMPRGDLPAAARAALRHWHENERVRLALGELAGFWEKRTLWGVSLQSRCVLDDSPRERHLIVVPFEARKEILQAAGKHLATLQGLALAADDWSDSERQALVRECRPTHVAVVGKLQEAPLAWPQDHQRPFGSLLLPG